MTNLYFQVCSFFYMIMIMILYFSKKSIDNKENSIFSVMSIINIIGISLDLVIVFLSYVAKNHIVLFPLNKIYLIYILLWTYFFVKYIAVITIKRTNIKTYLEKINIIFISVVSILIILLPIYLFNENNVMYTYGPSVTTLYIAEALFVLEIIVIILFNIKTILSRKYIPLFALVFISLIALVVRRLNPGILLTTSIITYINILMYHTIENPDVKMLNEVNLAKNQAEKANQAKTDFLSSMSHEIRTPLNAIVGFSSVIANADNLEEAKENAKDIVEASNSLLEIVNGILDISKIEAGKLELIYKDYDAYELFDSSAKLIDIKMKEKGLDFQVNIAKDLPKGLYGDPANIKKIVVNLLSNAYKYTDKGTVNYTVSNVIDKDICRLIISVEDTGRGIKKENIDKLFTKFQRLEEDRNTTIEGTGLGLAITKQLIEMMGGKIVCQSVYGSGTKFTVAIDQKIASMEEKIQTEKNEASLIDVSGKKVLIVDDNKLNLKVAERLLRSFNLQIELVESGFECLDKINLGEVYDLILLDDMMPKLSGTETLEKLKSIEGFNIPVVALTANAITGMREQYINAGFNDYLAKPIEKEEVIRIFKTYLVDNDDLKKGDFVSSKEEKQNYDKNLVLPNLVEKKDYDINYLKVNNIDVDNVLDLYKSEESYKNNLKQFYNSIKDRVLKLNDYVIKDDMKSFSCDIHELMADAMHVGLISVSKIALDLEIKSKQNDSSYVKEHFSNLLDKLKENIVIIKKYLQ